MVQRDGGRSSATEGEIPDRHRRPRRRRGARADTPATRRGGQGAGRGALTTEQVAARRASVPVIRYPDLPVTAVRDKIAALIREHQVVVVAGETGSGKTTQLPKICLELGRGVTGTIGHTQPRRIAARTVAERIAQELGTTVGDLVGWTVRFTDRAGPRTLVRVLTDGILLAEIQRDRMLSRYDTIIVDEAHERSLNVDFLLGYLKRLLPRRPDLKVIVTSATIDPARFSAYFDDAPVVQVSGRTYPVQVRYRPLLEHAAPQGKTAAADSSAAGLAGKVAGRADKTADGADQPDRTAGGRARGRGDGIKGVGTGERDQVQAICDAVVELAGEGPGDVLVFLSGEREIRDAADAVRALAQREPRLRGTEVLPLYARLTSAEQHRVFAPHTARRVVLATNVAETSLTVPGIRYVVDAGTARTSRYSRRLKVQRLPIEPISQASADQRAGRCGRVADGICVRLYSEQDYAARPRFTEPEILRTNLAAVILQMTALGLGDIAAFPFLEPPDRRDVRDGVQLLHELGAIDPDQPDPRRRLTATGRQLAQLPVDPRIGRMVVQAHREGCLPEVLVLAAALSIQDPRERPVDAQTQADQRHVRFRDPTSDFITWLNLWDHLRERQEALSGDGFRRMCREEYLHYLRIREWQDVQAQLRQVCRELNLGGSPAETSVSTSSLSGSAAESSSSPARDSSPSVLGEPAVRGDRADRVHRAVLAGLLSHIGLRDDRTRDYLGARGARFALWPGSALARKPPDLVVAAELVETSRLWARTVARVDAAWVEVLAPPHLLRRGYSEPHWSSRRAAAMARERVTVYGVPLVADRLVGYARVDPVASRELFIRHALVEGDWRTQHRFFHDNRELLDDVEALQERTRRHDLLVEDQVLYDFYDARIPADVVSGRHFDAWWKRRAAGGDDLQLLTFPRELVLRTGDDIGGVDDEAYPTSWTVPTADGPVTVPVTYQFEPGVAADGVTVHVPLPVLGRVSPQPFAWQVPGLRHELVTQLIRGLPKALRRSLIPAPDRASDVLDRCGPDDGPLVQVLADTLRELTGTAVRAQDFAVDALPTHLRVTFVVEDDAGRPLDRDTDLARLQHRLAPQLRAVIAAAVSADSVGASRSPGAPDAPGQVVERNGITTWDVGDLPKHRRTTTGGHLVDGYPALVDEHTSVAVRVFADAASAERAHAAGVRRLLRLTVPSPVPQVLSRLSNATKLVLSRAQHASATQLVGDCADAAVDALVARDPAATTSAATVSAATTSSARISAASSPVGRQGEPPRDSVSFDRLRDTVSRELPDELLDVVTEVAQILIVAYDVQSRLSAATSSALEPALADLRAQHAELIRPRFVTDAGTARLPDLRRYLQAMAVRLDRLPDGLARDRARQSQVEAARAAYDEALAGLPARGELAGHGPVGNELAEDEPAGRGPALAPPPQLREVWWMLQELRVSLFAPTMRTAYPVSVPRIHRALARATAVT
ncbi:MAG: DUF3418 domain-containing protein [Angustibacter sp.]